MSRRHLRTSHGQTLAALAVLAVLGILAAWLWTRQAIFSPAVEVALHPPTPVGSVRPAGLAAFATAAFLNDLPGTEATPAGVVESYDPDTLSDKIDGKAELYISAHFKEMSYRPFTLSDGTRVQMYVYALATPTDAFAVLSSQRRPGAQASTVTPEAYLAENTLCLAKGRFYVELVADRTGPRVAASLTAMATVLAGRLPVEAAKAAPSLVETSLFPTDGLDASSLRLTASDAMGMAGFTNVYTGDYSLPGGQATAFLAVRDTPEKAKADATAFAAFLTQNGYAPATPPAGAPAQPDGATLLATDGSFEIIFTRGRVLAGVHDATSLAAALELAGRLDRALESIP